MNLEDVSKRYDEMIEAFSNQCEAMIKSSEEAFDELIISSERGFKTMNNSYIKGYQDLISQATKANTEMIKSLSKNYMALTTNLYSNYNGITKTANSSFQSNINRFRDNCTEIMKRMKATPETNFEDTIKTIEDNQTAVKKEFEKGYKETTQDMEARYKKLIQKITLKIQNGTQGNAAVITFREGGVPVVKPPPKNATNLIYNPDLRPVRPGRPSQEPLNMKKLNNNN